jgi:hypothetical protein
LKQDLGIHARDSLAFAHEISTCKMKTETNKSILQTNGISSWVTLKNQKDEQQVQTKPPKLF